MWTSMDTRGCGAIAVVLLLLALVGLGAICWGGWYLLHHIHFAWRT